MFGYVTNWTCLLMKDPENSKLEQQKAEVKCEFCLIYKYFRFKTRGESH